MYQHIKSDCDKIHSFDTAGIYKVEWKDRKMRKDVILASLNEKLKEYKS